MKAYLVELGSIIKKGEHEFDFYSKVYDHQYGYYDNCQYYTGNKEKAIEDIRTYCKDHIRNYGILSDAGDIDDDAIAKEKEQDTSMTDEEAMRCIFISDEHYKTEDVIFSALNSGKDKIVEGFIQKK